MNAAPRKPSWHVERALKHVAQLREHLQRGLDFDDPLLQDAVSMQLIAAIDALLAADSVAGGAVSEAFDDSWRRIVGMRNVLVHQYVVLDVDVLRNAVTRELGTVETVGRGLLHSWETA